MEKVTRRAMLLKASATAAIGAVLPMGGVEAAAAQERPGEVFHAFAFRWKEGTTEEQIERARHDILAFQGVIPGLLQTHVGPNLSTKGDGYTFGGVMEFRDKAALDAYPTHPAHQALLQWLVPLIHAIELDLRA